MHISIYSNLLPIVITVCSAASISNEEIAKILGDRETLNSVRSINSMQDDLDEFKNRLGAMRDLPGEMDDNLYDTLETDDDNDDGVVGDLDDINELEDMFPRVSTGYMSLRQPPFEPEFDRRTFVPGWDTSFSPDGETNEEEEDSNSVERRNPFCGRFGCIGKKAGVREVLRGMMRKRFICNSRWGCGGDGENFQDFNGQRNKMNSNFNSVALALNGQYPDPRSTQTRDTSSGLLSRYLGSNCGSDPC